MPKDLLMPDGSRVDFSEPTPEVQALSVIAQNQAAIHGMLAQISHQIEIQIRIACGVDTKSKWKLRFLEAERLATEAEAAAAEDTVEDDDAQVSAVPSDV